MFVYLPIDNCGHISKHRVILGTVFDACAGQGGCGIDTGIEMTG